MDVVITVHLPDEVAAPLSAADTARGVRVEKFAAERVAEGLVGQDAMVVLEAFPGWGSSGRHEALEVPEVRRGLTAQATPCGI